MKGFSITRSSSTFSIRLDTFRQRNSVNTNLNVQPGACNVNPLLKNLGYNKNLTQNQKDISNYYKKFIGNYFYKYYILQ